MSLCKLRTSPGPQARIDTDATYVGSEVLTAVVMKSSVFWDITPCGPLKVNRRLGGTCRLHHQGRRISQAIKQSEATGKQSLWPSS
jgi:hypothetical protein